MIDRNSRIPIYYQIEDWIKGQILNNSFEIDKIIPSERELMALFNVSRHTIRQAIGNLVNEGYLYRMTGKGTFVKDRHLIYKENKYTSFTEDMKQVGKRLYSRVIECEVLTASDMSTNRLAIGENSQVIKVSRVRIADEVPLAYEIFYISKDIVGSIDEKYFEGSIIHYYENILNLRLDHAMETIESIQADSQTAKMLEIEENSPILLIKSKLYMENGKQLHYVKNYFRGDQYKVSIRLKR